ncbi:hypothetical protein SAMN05421813_11764 [Daejeonella rubra]|uniref:Uncharacterized protein n=1 Tax=Daejeonella rubra TaxID=990371 RepID=A0A1G9URS2_9SPHI|nr:hypothetical protein [Daejeonella rubra]SDM62648.1 hypothetical protein SAMN05421813_11764 [Daejeonella rubra]
MQTFLVTDKIVQGYLNELVPSYLLMNFSPLDEIKMRCEIDELDAASWHERFAKKIIEKTLTKLESAILNTRTKVKVPADLVPEITLLIFYIGGSKFFAVNDQVGQAVIDEAIGNYIKAHRLFKEQKLDRIYLELRTSSKSEVIFNNLALLYPLHEKVLKAIEESLMISTDSDLYKIIHNPETKSSELKALELKYSTKLLRIEKSVLANGALLLSRYLKEVIGMPNKGHMISDDQIKIIYKIYSIMDWVNSKSRPNHDNPNGYIKVFRNFIRDNQTLI